MSLVLIVLLTVLGAFFLLAPAFMRGSREQNAARRADILRDAYREQLKELSTADTQDPAVQKELETEMGRLLLSEVGVAQEASMTEQTLSRVWLVGIAGVVLAVSWALFVFVADLGVEDVAGAEAVMTMDHRTDADALADWRQRLEARVADNPDDDKSLYLLAHTLLKVGDFRKAVDAFARAAQSSPNDLTIKVYLLQAQYLAGNGALTQAGRKLANDILEQEPNIPIVLQMLASDEYRRGAAPAAVRLLHKAINSSRNPAQQAGFAQAISEIRKQIDLPGISVRVEPVSAVPQEATLFVIARPVGGGMPYAVVRRPAAVLPATVRLDSLVSMAEGRSLPATEPFEVVVRLSMSGQPVRQPGDWQWEQEIAGVMRVDELVASLAPPGKEPAVD